MDRLTTRREFLAVARAGHKWATPGLVLQARKSGTADGPLGFRVGYTVSKKVGNAVKRNRARRRLRAAAARVMPQLAERGHDFVIIGRRGTLHRPFQDLTTDLSAAIRKLNAAQPRKDGA